MMVDREQAIEATAEVTRRLVREREYRISVIGPAYVDAILSLPSPVADAASMIGAWMCANDLDEVPESLRHYMTALDVALDGRDT